MAESGQITEPALDGDSASHGKSETEESEGEVDPRVKGELDDMNAATDDINRHEKELEITRHAFNQVMEEATVQLNTMRKSLGQAITKARPYFEMRRKAKKANVSIQLAAQKYEKVIGQNMAAKEMVARAEENVLQNGGKAGVVGNGPEGVDQAAMAWMESLNYATLKVMEYEKQRQDCQLEHQRASSAYSQCERELRAFYKKNKRSIKKAMPYFERHASYYLSLEKLKRKVQSLQEDVSNAKKRYRNALKSLEAISEEIHRARQQEASHVKDLVREAVEGAPSPEAGPDDIRTDGVGAESSAVDLALAQGVGDVLARMTQMSYSCSSLSSLGIPESHNSAESQPEDSFAADFQDGEDLDTTRPSVCGQSSSSSSSLDEIPANEDCAEEKKTVAETAASQDTSEEGVCANEEVKSADQNEEDEASN